MTKAAGDPTFVFSSSTHGKPCVGWGRASYGLAAPFKSFFDRVPVAFGYYNPLQPCVVCNRIVIAQKKLQKGSTCSECARVKYLRLARSNKLRSKFKISDAEYEQRLSTQRGLCAICERPCKSGRRLAVDHDHATGRVRGLLCAMCNTGIGKLGDTADALRKALAYLEKIS